MMELTSSSEMRTNHSVSNPADSRTQARNDGDLLVPSVGEAPEVRISTGSALTLISKITSLGTSFIIGVLVARIFGVGGKGTLSIILQVPGLMVVALDLGISTSIIYYVSRGESRPGTVAANALLMAGVLGVLGAPVIFVLLAGPLAIIHGVPVWAIVLAMSILPLGLVAAWMSSVSIGLSNLVLPLWFAIASSTTTLVGLAILLATHHGSLTSVIAVSVAGTVVGIVVYLWGLRHHVRPLRPDLREARGMARFSAKAYLSSIAGLLHERQDILLLGWLSGTAAVGLYSVGVSFAELAWYIPGALGSAILAKGSRRGEESATDYTTRTTRVAMIFMLFTVGVSLLAVPWVVPLVYGRAFAPAAFAFFALAPGIVADGVSRILWSYQITRGRMYWQMSVGTMTLNFAAVLVLVPVWGAVGAGLASSISYSVLCVLVIRRFCIDTGATASEILIPRKSDLEVVVRAIAGIIQRRNSAPDAR